MSPSAPSRLTGARRGVFVATAVFLVANGMATMAQAGAHDGPVLALDIPAQDARRALVDLCLAAGCEVAYVAAQDKPPRSQTALSLPLKGRMTWRAAVAEMLRDTSLRYRFVGARGVRVWSEAAPPAAPRRAAPEPPPSEVEDVVVVGRFVEQVETSLRRKRAADVISDSTSAARIGELPAANLAEALQRVPGVAIEREVGEGQFVSVRGLGPLFQSVTLNGAPVAFNENIRNSTQSGRQFRFRALSAELLAGAQVTKSATPDLIEGGIGSNIDIETIRGLGGDGFASLRAGGAIEDRARDVRPNLSLAGRFVSKGADWGLVGGVSQEARSVVYDRFQIQRYLDLTLAGQTVTAPSDVRTTVEQEDRRRRSLFLGGEWAVTPRMRFRFDSLISTFDNAIREDRLAYGLGARLAEPGSRFTLSDGVVTAGTVRGGRIDNNTELSEQSHLNMVASAGLELDLGAWTLTPRITGSSARSRLDTPLERISFQSARPVAYSFDVENATRSRKAPLLQAELDVKDPGALKFQRLGVRAIESLDDDLTLMADAARRLDGSLGGLRLMQVRLGVQVSDRSRDYQRRDREAMVRPGAVVSSDFLSLTTPDDVFDRLLSRHPGPWTVADFSRFRDAFIISGEHDGVVVTPHDLKPTGSDLQNAYQVSERVGAAYARLDFEGEAWALPFTGNLGVRAVATRTHVGGAVLEADVAGGSAIRPISHDAETLVLLPSANIALDLDDHRRLRLAVSRTMTRPSLADLRLATAPASTLVFAIYERGQAEIDAPSPGTIFTGVGGNPALKPYVSTNLDLSYEWSFTGGALSIAAFHKQIENFIVPVAAPERLTFETRAGPLVQTEVLMLRPRNLGRASTQGLELGFYRRLPSGLGLWANATWTDSHGPNGEARLTGVSDLAYSINPFIDRGPLSAGLSWSWRSAFRSEADMQGGGVSDFIIGSAGYLDAQASYDLGGGAQIVISATNLTDTTDLAYETERRRLLQLGRVGRSLVMSLKWAL